VHVYTIKFDFPNLPRHGDIDVTGLDQIFQNGKEYTISAAQAEMFRAHNQRPVVSDDPLGPVEYEPGPTLLEAFKDNQYVTVATAKAPQSGGEK
jgi:hypothetical protein